ncbi:MAG: hypothetical protein AB7T27_07925 [Kiritimatiellia bacterium]
MKRSPENIFLALLIITAAAGLCFGAGDAPFGYIESTENTLIPVPDAEHIFAPGESYPLLQDNAELFIVALSEDLLAAVRKLDRKGNPIAWVTLQKQLIFGDKARSVEGSLLLQAGDELLILKETQNSRVVEFSAYRHSVRLDIPKKLPAGLAFVPPEKELVPIEQPVQITMAGSEKPSPPKPAPKPVAVPALRPKPKPVPVVKTTAPAMVKEPVIEPAPVAQPPPEPQPAPAPAPVPVQQPPETPQPAEALPEKPAEPPQPAPVPAAETAVTPAPEPVAAAAETAKPVEAPAPSPAPVETPPDAPAEVPPEEAPAPAAAEPPAELPVPVEAPAETPAETSIVAAVTETAAVAVAAAAAEPEAKPAPPVPRQNPVIRFLDRFMLSSYILLLIAVIEGVFIIKLRRKAAEPPGEAAAEEEPPPVLPELDLTEFKKYFQSLRTSMGQISGPFGDFTTYQLVYYLHTARETGGLELEQKKGIVSAEMFFSNGEIVHGFVGNKVDDEAVLEVLCMKCESFNYTHLPVIIEQHTIRNPTVNFLIAAAPPPPEEPGTPIEEETAEPEGPAAEPQSQSAEGASAEDDEAASMLARLLAEDDEKPAAPAKPEAAAGEGESDPEWDEIMKTLKVLDDMKQKPK